jgi:Tol biopolymer transport system component
VRRLLSIAAFATLLVLPAGAAAHGAGGTLLVQFDDGRIATLGVDDGRLRGLGRGSTGAWSPDGRRIALSRGGDLVVVTADGRRSRRLTHDDLIQFAPDWSPDETRIAFLQQHPEVELGVGPQDDVAVVDVASGVTRRLTSDARSKTALSWSPDGTQLVYESVGRPLPRPVVVIDAASGNIVVPAAVRPYPLWSPNGRNVAYVTVEAEHSSLLVAAADGSSPRVLFRGARDTGVFDLAWSPNGRFLVFAYGGWSSSNSRLEVADIVSGSVSAVTALRSHDSAPTWSPDSGWIAFARYEQARRRYAVAVVDRSGRNLHVLLRSNHFAQPLWQPRAD